MIKNFIMIDDNHKKEIYNFSDGYYMPTLTDNLCLAIFMPEKGLWGVDSLKAYLKQNLIRLNRIYELGLKNPKVLIN